MKTFFAFALAGLFLCCAFHTSQGQQLHPFFPRNTNQPNPSDVAVAAGKVSERGGPDLRLLGDRQDSWTTQWVGSDSSLYIYTNNRLTEIRNRNFDGLLWVLDYHNLYEYDVNGNQIKDVSQSWDGGAWVNNYQTNYVFDAAHHITLSTNQSWDGTIWQNQYRSSYDYDANGNQTQSIGQNWLGGVWENSSRQIRTYDANNNLTLRTNYSWSGSGWVEYYRSSYDYNAGGKLIAETEQSWDGSTWVNSYRYTFQYDANGNSTLYLTQSWISGVWENSTRTTYDYNAGNRQTLQLYQYWISGAWENSSRYVYQYDANNKWIHYLAQIWDSGAWANATSAVIDEAWFDSANGYSFFNNYVIQGWDGAAWINSARYFGYFETFVGLQTLARSFDCSLYPNPANGGMVRLEVSDEAVQPERFTLYDVHGRRLSSRALSGNNVEQIELGQLQTGQYFLEVQARGGKKAVLPLQIR